MTQVAADEAPPAGDGTGPEAVLAGRAAVLAAAVEAALPGWVERSVAGLVVAYTGSADPVVLAEARAAGSRAAAEVGARVRALLETDVDAQRTGPLDLLRAAVAYPAAVLTGAGVPPVVRDAFAEAHFPDDVYGLTPASFADVDPALHDPGLEWGAAKALAHRRRHLPAGPGPDGGRGR